MTLSLSQELQTQYIPTSGWYGVHYFFNPRIGFEAYIAVHNINRGPALGGCRMLPYQSKDDALIDVLRLSKGMTYKAACAELPVGGGKSIIIGDPATQKTDAILESMAYAVDLCNGILDMPYLIAEDVGTTLEDLTKMSKITKFTGSTAGSGDPSPMTAYGVFRGIVDSILWKLGVTSLSGITIAVLGVGKVGYDLVKHLRQAGAVVYVADIDKTKVDRAVNNFGAIGTTEDRLLRMRCDVFAPCALGGIINDDTVDSINCQIIAGCANNQLLDPGHGERIHSREILYAPDYVINPGGIINVHCEIDGSYSEGRAMAMCSRISRNLINIYEESRSTNTPTYVLADRMAEKIFNEQK